MEHRADSNNSCSYVWKGWCAVSVYIKGMEMPTSCEECAFNAEFRCIINHQLEGKDTYTHSCPLVPVPAHGRLIDADALAASFRESVHECRKWADEIFENGESNMYARVSQSLGTFVEACLRTKAAPTIIPAEEGEK